MRFEGGGGRAYRNEKVADGRGKVQQAVRAQGLHEPGDAAQLVQVVGDADERQNEQHVAVAGVAVLAQHVQHLGRVLVARDNAAVGTFPKEVQEAVGRVAVVTREGEEGELPVAVENRGLVGMEEKRGERGEWAVSYRNKTA